MYWVRLAGIFVSQRECQRVKVKIYINDQEMGGWPDVMKC